MWTVKKCLSEEAHIFLCKVYYSMILFVLIHCLFRMFIFHMCIKWCLNNACKIILYETPFSFILLLISSIMRMKHNGIDDERTRSPSLSSIFCINILNRRCFVYLLACATIILFMLHMCWSRFCTSLLFHEHVRLPYIHGIWRVVTHDNVQILRIDI